MKFINKYLPENKILRVLYYIVLILISYGIIMYTILMLFLLALHLFVEKSEMKNPSERNYLVFENESVESVIDSIYVFRDLLKEMNLPEHPNIRNVQYFSYRNNGFHFNKNNIGKLDFITLRQDSCFDNASDEQIKSFINLFDFLLDNYIDPGSYNLSTETLNLNYKSLYKMYPDNLSAIQSVDFRFIEVLPSSSWVLDEHFMILDSFNNVYLTAFKQKKVKSDDTKYIRKER